jgi:hypothetical protein
MSENPMSSTRITTMLGFSAAEIALQKIENTTISRLEDFIDFNPGKRGCCD